MTIIQIVPRRSDRACGVGDYATRLASVFRSNHGLETTFLSGAPANVEPLLVDDWPTVAAPQRKGAALSKALGELHDGTANQTVLLHVSGYGYQDRGVPFWLLQGVRAWRSANPKGLLIGVFHELYATGPIWRSSFWTSRAQQYVTKELWNLCDFGWTTNDVYRETLFSWRPSMGDRLLSMPVFSNVGEPPEAPQSTDRAPRIAVFGQPGVESRIYIQPGATQAAAAAAALGATEIVDIGRRQLPPTGVGAMAVNALGHLSAENVGEALRGCRFGFLHYDIERLGKSGVFAAYAANGVIPICLGSTGNPRDGLEAEKHLLVWPFDEGPRDLNMMQHALMQWYNQHSLATQAARLSAWLTTRRPEHYHAARGAGEVSGKRCPP